jgi:hypothetical protein
MRRRRTLRRSTETPMTTYRTRCECGQLSVTVEGDPMVVAACNCRNCQRRSSAPFIMNAWFRKSQIVSIDGQSKTYHRTSDFGRTVERHFCPDCGTQIYVYTDLFRDGIGLNATGFEDESLRMPTYVAYTRSKFDWVRFPEGIPASETQPR